MVDKRILYDPRYFNIGDLPTGFAAYKSYGLTEIYLRPFIVRELPLLHLAARSKTGGISHIIRAVNMVSSTDISMLTDGDFEFLLAWLRKASYPESPMLVNWTCRKTNVVEKDTKKIIPDKEADCLTEVDMSLHNYIVEECGYRNTSIVHTTKVLVDSLDDDCLYIPHDDIDFARVNTLEEYEKIIEEHPEYKEIASIARHVKKGSTLKEKIDILENSDIDLYERIIDVQHAFQHGIRENMILKCRECQNQLNHTSHPNLRTFFADNTETDIYDIQYHLMSEFGVPPDDDMPIKKLLYHHACLIKDKQDEREKQTQQRNSAKIRARPNYNVNR